MKTVSSQSMCKAATQQSTDTTSLGYWVTLFLNISVSLNQITICVQCCVNDFILFLSWLSPHMHVALTAWRYICFVLKQLLLLFIKKLIKASIFQLVYANIGSSSAKYTTKMLIYVPTSLWEVRNIIVIIIWTLFKDIIWASHGSIVFPDWSITSLRHLVPISAAPRICGWNHLVFVLNLIFPISLLQRFAHFSMSPCTFIIFPTSFNILGICLLFLNWMLWIF